MYTVIGKPQTRTMRVIWCLEELGLDYDINPVAPTTDAAKEFNPSGKIPALLDGEDVIIDSVAICQYLADKHAKMTFPAGTIERGKMDSWTNFAIDEVDQACWIWSKHDFFYPENMRVEAIKPVCEAEFSRAMKTLETRLGDNKYVMGDTFTVPDIILGHCANWAQNTCKFTIPEGNVLAYFERVRSRPALKRAIANNAS